MEWLSLVCYSWLNRIIQMTMPTSQTSYSNFLFIMLKFHKCAKRLNSNSRSSNNAFVLFFILIERLIIVDNQKISLSFMQSIGSFRIISKNEYEKKRKNSRGALFFSLSLSFSFSSLHTIQSTVHEVHWQEEYLWLFYYSCTNEKLLPFIILIPNKTIENEGKGKRNIIIDIWLVCWPSYVKMPQGIFC
jgi:hypothetical protein